MEPLEIRHVGFDRLGLYAKVPESFMCESDFRIEPFDVGLRASRSPRRILSPT